MLTNVDNDGVYSSTGSGIMEENGSRYISLTAKSSSHRIRSLKENRSLAILPTEEEDDDKTGGVLACLWGDERNRDRFFNEDIGRNVVHFRRGKVSLSSSSSSSSSTTTTTTRDVCSPLLNEKVDIGNLIFHSSSYNYTTLRQRGSMKFLKDVSDTIPTYQELQSYIEQGGSAVISIVVDDDDDDDDNNDNNNDNDDNVFGPLLRHLESLLNHTVSMNVYHSGPEAVALNRHYDAYDVIVLQLDGNKEWEVCLPSHDKNNPTTVSTSTTSSIQGPSSEKNDRGVWTNITMMPGDLLYIPQGIFHAATTASGFSSTTHVTIGLIT